MNTPSLPWNGPPRLWSLADLIECKIAFLMQAYEQLRGVCDSLYQRPNLRAEMSDEDKVGSSRYSIFHELEQCKDVIDDHRIALSLGQLQFSLSGKGRMTPELLISKLEAIKHDLILVISERKFAYIPKGVAGYFEQDRLFGDAVHRKFPKARDDIKDAGNCIAAGLNTAAVFHLMRIAEYGFRFAATRGGVVVKEKSKPLAIEFAGWEKIISGLKAKSDQLRQTPKGISRERKAQAYADLSDQCLYIRDVYRDKTMHARKRYSEFEAHAAFHRVGQFMHLLAERNL